MTIRQTRYRFFDAKSRKPILGDDPKDQDKSVDNAPKQKDDDDTPLKNVDQNDGGYGHGSGFDKE